MQALQVPKGKGRGWARKPRNFYHIKWCKEMNFPSWHLGKGQRLPLQEWRILTCLFSGNLWGFWDQSWPSARWKHLSHAMLVGLGSCLPGLPGWGQGVALCQPCALWAITASHLVLLWLGQLRQRGTQHSQCSLGLLGITSENICPTADLSFSSLPNFQLQIFFVLFSTKTCMNQVFHRDPDV